MSQRTRSRTTAGAARKRVAADDSLHHDAGQLGAEAVGAHSSTEPDSHDSERPAEGTASPTPVNPEIIARRLRAAAADLKHAAALVEHAAASIGSLSPPAPAPAPARPRARTALPDSSAALESAGSLAHTGRTKPSRSASKPAARVFTPSLVTGISPDLGPGIPDPFALAKRLGPDGLRAALAELRRGTLRAIIREHGIAPAAQVARISDDTRLREMILAAVLT